MRLKTNWTKYEGEFKSGIREGQGTLTLANGEKFVGTWENGLVNGEGEIYRTDGTVVKGQWVNGTMLADEVPGFGELKPTF